MKDHNLLRIERLTTRYNQRVSGRHAPDAADFLGAFAELRERVLRPQMEELAGELRKAGHRSRVVDRDEAPEGGDGPAIELELGLEGGTGSRNLVGFSVIRWTGYPLQILAYLVINPPPFDIDRFASAAEVSADRVEQILVDAIEQILAVNAP
jgi:hypothetical protein